MEAKIRPLLVERCYVIKAVRYADKDLQMPPKRQLAPEEVFRLTDVGENVVREILS